MYTHTMKKWLCKLVLLVCLLMGFASPAHAVKIKGIDVSRWQGTIDWEQVKAAKVKFTMIGMGRVYGDRLDLDPQFENNITGAIENNIHVGIYLFSLATTELQAIKEANLVLDAIEGYNVSYPVVVDMEAEAQRKLTNKKRTDIALAFMETIEAAGYYPMLYASENWLKESMDYSRMEKYDMWVARWRDGMTFEPVSIWQYSSTGHVDGIDGYVDLDYSYKRYETIIEPRTRAVNADNRYGWRTINKKTYYFKSDGSVTKGWKKIDGKKYYFTKYGVLKKGWFTYKGKSYYTDSKTGRLKTGWVKRRGKMYYVKKSVKQTGWLKRKGKKYYLGTNGARVTGTVEIDGKSYTFDSVTGALIDENDWRLTGENI